MDTSATIELKAFIDLYQKRRKVFSSKTLNHHQFFFYVQKILIKINLKSKLATRTRKFSTKNPTG